MASCFVIGIEVATLFSAGTNLKPSEKHKHLAESFDVATSASPHDTATWRHGDSGSDEPDARSRGPLSKAMTQQECLCLYLCESWNPLAGKHGGDDGSTLGKLDPELAPGNIVCFIGRTKCLLPARQQITQQILASHQLALPSCLTFTFRPELILRVQHCATYPITCKKNRRQNYSSSIWNLISRTSQQSKEGHIKRIVR
ncbi:hypothetical protein GGR55DRAFT_676297 [Xylaria sp. FL0064]|nr:hypothetical protein GGR55DRAFT_676297 [Xylaria sp. FL0064]